MNINLSVDVSELMGALEGVLPKEKAWDALGAMMTMSNSCDASVVLNTKPTLTYGKPRSEMTPEELAAVRKKDREYRWARSARGSFPPSHVPKNIELVKMNARHFLANTDNWTKPVAQKPIHKTFKAPRFTFKMLELDTGDVLTFSHDPSITCEVYDKTKVLFNGEKLCSLTALSAYLMPTRNIHKALNHWTFNGELLYKRRIRLARFN